jgi:hypothetical protein
VILQERALAEREGLSDEKVEGVRQRGGHGLILFHLVSTLDTSSIFKFLPAIAINSEWTSQATTYNMRLVYMIAF